MTVTEIINKILEKKELSKVGLAKEIGVEKNNLGNKLKRDNFSVLELVEIADALDMQLVLREKTKKIKENPNEYIIDYPEEIKGKPKRKQNELDTGSKK